MSETEYIGVSSPQVSPNTFSCVSPKRTTPEQTPPVHTGCIGSGTWENKILPGVALIEKEPGDMGTAASQSGAVKSLQPSSKDMTGPCVTEDLEQPSEDVHKSSLSGKISSPKVNAIDQKIEFDSEDVLNAPSDEKKSQGSKYSQYTAREIVAGVSRHFNTKNNKSRALPKVVTNFSEDLEGSHNEATKIDQVDSSSAPEETLWGQALAFHSDDTSCRPLEERKKSDSTVFQDEFVTKNASLPCYTTIAQLEPCCEIVTESKVSEHVGAPPDNDTKIPSIEESRLPQAHLDKCSNPGQVETPMKDTVNGSNRFGRRIKRTPNSKKKYMLRSLIGNDRVLRSRSQTMDKASMSSTNPATINSSKEEVKKKRKKRRKQIVVTDEYSRIRKHLRYLLNRISYEQSLIIAYSGEGWKGQSLEKIKLEKELQRARCEILRRKLKIRDLFQRIDSLCAEGRLPASVFDSEGQITSEDIFCAKCGSKDLTADNDIILCDGACDRGFHQFCLVPPLLKEDIPPDDEGWLCPGCDCKVDCADLLNDSQGTDLSITDSWEKVFPEAAAAAAGQNLDNNVEFPSDDSEDNDYDPESSKSGENSQEDEPSSDESDFTSASDDLVGLADDKQYLGLPSEDSGDDDYNPDAPNHDEVMKQESSSSDFTSDSEDLAALGNNELSGEDQSTPSIRTGKDSSGGRSKLGKKEDQSLKSELSSILASDPSPDVSAPISGKRNIERLDYKKLYDETYGNISSSSDDDGDYTDTVGPSKRRRSRTEDFVSASVNGITSVPKGGGSVELEDLRQDVKDAEHTPRRARQKSSSRVENISPLKAHESSSLSNSSGKRIRSSAYKKLGEAATQRLYKSFNENQYPNRAAKESLAKELGLTFKQVTKWFENARWSFNHSPSMAAKIAAENLENGPSVPKANEGTPRTGPEKTTCNGAQIEEASKADGVAMDGSNVRENEMDGQNSKRKPVTSVSEREENTDYVKSRVRIVESPQASTKAQGTLAAGRKTKRRKSVT